MKIAAIETSSRTLCVGVRDGNREYGYDVEYGTRLSRCLVPALDRVFAAARLKVSDIDHFACGIGPGSFTGIRIGMACVKGLAWPGGAPVTGVCSLDIIALNARKEDGVIAAVIDARRGFVYAGLYRMRGDVLSRVVPYLLVSPQGLAEEIKKRLPVKTPVVFCGDGIPVIREQLASAGNARFLDADHWKPQSRHLLELASRRIDRGESSDALSIKPLYLYPKECQIRKS